MPRKALVLVIVLAFADCGDALAPVTLDEPYELRTVTRAALHCFLLLWCAPRAGSKMYGIGVGVSFGQAARR